MILLLLLFVVGAAVGGAHSYIKKPKKTAKKSIIQGEGDVGVFLLLACSHEDSDFFGRAFFLFILDQSFLCKKNTID